MLIDRMLHRRQQSRRRKTPDHEIAMTVEPLPIELGNRGIKRWLCLHLTIQRRRKIPETKEARAPPAYAKAG